jgi:hypothetical protein
MSIKKIGFAFGGLVASGKTYTAESISYILDCNIHNIATFKDNSDKLNSDISFAIIDDLRTINEYNELKNDKFCRWYFIYISVPQLTRLERIKKLYPDNWREYFNRKEECIPVNKYDCISLSIDHTLKFIYNVIGQI